MKTLLLSLAAFWIVSFAAAQKISYRHFTPKDGLLDLTTTCIFEDSKGYIWIGTKSGLSIYDGKHFKNYDVRDGLPNSYVAQIDEVDGSVWVMTRFGGLSQFEVGGRLIKHYSLKGKVPEDWEFNGTGIRLSKGKFLLYLSQNSTRKHLIFDTKTKQLEEYVFADGGYWVVWEVLSDGKWFISGNTIDRELENSPELLYLYDPETQEKEAVQFVERGYTKVANM
ncbi:MAG: two-component regulator propeller domain-containing protein, partial [Bacteroidota bacterium]